MSGDLLMKRNVTLPVNLIFAIFSVWDIYTDIWAPIGIALRGAIYIYG